MPMVSGRSRNDVAAHPTRCATTPFGASAAQRASPLQPSAQLTPQIEEPSEANRDE